MREPAAAATLLCPVHPGFPLGGTCSRCGTFVCVRCAPDLAMVAAPLCLKCRESRITRAAPASLRDVALEVSAVQLAFGGVTFALMMSIDAPVAFSAAAALPFLVGSAALFALQRAVVAWVSLAVQFAVMTAIFLWQLDNIVDGLGRGEGPPVRLLLLVLMAVPVYLVRRVQKIGELERLAAKALPL